MRIANQKVDQRLLQLAARIAGVEGAQARAFLLKAYGHVRRLIQNTQINSVSNEKEAT